MAFDPQQFLNQTYDDPNSTRGVPPPPDEYDATIHSLGTPRQFTNRDGEPQLVLDVICKLDDPSSKVEAKTNRKENFTKYALFLDVQEGAGGQLSLDMRDGRNVSLGILRSITDLNGSGFTFEKLVVKRVHVTTIIDTGNDGVERSVVARNGVTAIGGGASSSATRRPRRGSEEATA